MRPLRFNLCPPSTGGNGGLDRWPGPFGSGRTLPGRVGGAAGLGYGFGPPFVVTVIPVVIDDPAHPTSLPA